jgi:hypothetical protein
MSTGSVSPTIFLGRLAAALTFLIGSNVVLAQSMPGQAGSLAEQTRRVGVFQATFVAPDFKRSKLVHALLAPGQGSLALPSLNGLSAVFSYDDTQQSSSNVELITWWASNGNPPIPSNNGTIIAWERFQMSPNLATFGTASADSSITYKKLSAAKTYSIDGFDVTDGFELRGFPHNIGSPTKGTLTFASPLNGVCPGGCLDRVLVFELVQNM